jgi:hypothetical protein
MSWVRHVVHVGDRTGVYRVWSIVLKGRDHLDDLDLDGRMILKFIFKKWDEGAWTGLIWLGIGIGGAPL